MNTTTGEDSYPHNTMVATPDIDAALHNIQADLPTLVKDRTANTEKYTYTYVDLAQVTREILPLLNRNKLVYTCEPDLTMSGRFVLRWTLTHPPSGQQRTGAWPLPETTNPQTIGSMITYARRYILCALTGTVADPDDDGHSAAADIHPTTPKPLAPYQRALARALIEHGADNLEHAKMIIQYVLNINVGHPYDLTEYQAHTVMRYLDHESMATDNA